MLSIREYKSTTGFKKILDNLNDREYEYATTLLGPVICPPRKKSYRNPKCEYSNTRVTVGVPAVQYLSPPFVALFDSDKLKNVIQVTELSTHRLLGSNALQFGNTRFYCSGQLLPLPPAQCASNDSDQVIMYQSSQYIVYEITDSFAVLRTLESSDEGLYCDGSKEVYIKDKVGLDKIKRLIAQTRQRGTISSNKTA